MSQSFEFFHWNHHIASVGDPIDLSKAVATDKPTVIPEQFKDMPVAKIVGLVTAAGKDFQGEHIDQQGIDWAYFCKSGWINYEHQGGMENVVGYPDRDLPPEEAIDADGNPATRITMWILLDERGKKIYDKMKMLQKAGGGRQFGFSIEGQALERDHLDPKRITKCRVKNVAITAHPVRDTARVEMVKSLAGDLMGADLSQIEIPQATESAENIDNPPSTLQYKTAAAGLSALLPDSIDNRLANKSITYSELCGKIRKSFPRVAEEDVRKIAKRLIEVAKARGKTAA